MTPIFPRIVHVTIFAMLTLSMYAPASAEPKKAFVRESLQTFAKDPKKLVSLIRGIQVMKQRNSAPKGSAEYRKSWEYWAAIHGYAGPTSPSGPLSNVRAFFETTFPQQAPLLSGFYDGIKELEPPSTPAGLAEEIWYTCKHGSEDEYQPHFLTWHRMYLFFFERVLREASGDADFVLPYWDYTNNTINQSDPTSSPWRVPSAFLFSGEVDVGLGPVRNPLFEPRRTVGFGQTVQLDVMDTNVDSLLALKDFHDFQNTLDLTIHGHIHCAVGNRCMAPFIGIVPFAGNEPLFWLHHANIDRLWECWRERNGRDAHPVDQPDWMQEEFVFVDENGDRVVMKVSELFSQESRIDYSYDNSSNCFRTAPPKSEPEIVSSFNQAPEQKSRPLLTKRTEIASVSNIRIDKAEKDFEMVPAASKSAGDALLFAVRPTVIRPSIALLKLDGLKVKKPTGAAIRVFLTNKKNGNSSFVSSVNFFGWFDPSHKHHATPATSGRSLTLDVTQQLRELSVSGGTLDDIGLNFTAASGVNEGLTPTAIQTFESSNVSISRASLIVEEQSRFFNFE